jgi:hypothetical protein
MPRKKKDIAAVAEAEVIPLEETEVVEAPEPVGADEKRRLDMRYIPIDLIIPNSWNANVMDDLTFNRLQDEIAEVGFIDPLEVVPNDEGFFVIIGGEHRWRSAKNLGFTEVPCVVLGDAKWKDQDLQKFVTVRLNVIHGGLDPDKFVVLYNEMADKYGADSIQHLMGMTDTQKFQKMLGWVKKGLKTSLPKEMATQIDDATKEVKSVADLSRIIQELFNRYGETVNQSFMVFVYGKQQHIYVQMDVKMRRAMEQVMEASRVLNKDINELLLPVFEGLAKSTNIQIEAQKMSEALNPAGPVAQKKEEW